MDGLHVVLGATGGAGSAVVRELAARGLPTRALGRKDMQFPAGVEYVRGDALDPATLRRVCQGAAVVYHCINVPYAQWERTLPQLARHILQACAETGARLVVMDNLYMYGPVEGPIIEETPRRAVGPKGRLRAQLEETFLNAHRERKVDVCIARASDFYGPPSAGGMGSPGRKGNNVAAQLVLEPAMAGKQATWLGSLEAPTPWPAVGSRRRMPVTPSRMFRWTRALAEASRQAAGGVGDPDAKQTDDELFFPDAGSESRFEFLHNPEQGPPEAVVHRDRRTAQNLEGHLVGGQPPVQRLLLSKQ